MKHSLQINMKTILRPLVAMFAVAMSSTNFADNDDVSDFAQKYVGLAHSSVTSVERDIASGKSIVNVFILDRTCRVIVDESNSERMLVEKLNCTADSLDSNAKSSDVKAKYAKKVAISVTKATLVARRHAACLMQTKATSGLTYVANRDECLAEVNLQLSEINDLSEMSRYKTELEAFRQEHLPQY